MKAILAVDLEDGTVSQLAARLRERQIDVRLQRVSRARAAEAVRRDAFDLVVFDRGEAQASPAALVAALGETSPATRLVVLGTVERQDRALFASLGSVETLAHPVEVAELAARIATALQRGVKGHLESVGLAAFVQLLALEKETCTLSVRSSEGSGTLFFGRGELHDAELGESSGEDAAIGILGWEITDVEMSGSCLRSRRAIQTPLTFLLMEAMRRRDEHGRGEAGAAGPGGGGSLAAGAAAAAGTGDGADAAGYLAGLARDLPGFLTAVLVDLATGAPVEAASTRPDFDANLASAFCCELVRQELAHLRTFEQQSTLDDLVLTFADEIHVIQLGRSGRFLYVVADRARTNLAALRGSLRAQWEALEANAAAGGRPARERSTHEWEWKI